MLVLGPKVSRNVGLRSSSLSKCPFWDRRFLELSVSGPKVSRNVGFRSSSLSECWFLVLMVLSKCWFEVLKSSSLSKCQFLKFLEMFAWGSQVMVVLGSKVFRNVGLGTNGFSKVLVLGPKASRNVGLGSKVSRIISFRADDSSTILPQH